MSEYATITPMLVHFSEKERAAIKAIAQLMDVAEERVVILALRHYQLKLAEQAGYQPGKSPGCGVVE